MIRLKSKCGDDCSQCEPSVIATYTTNGDNPTWDLTPYRGDGVGKPNALWRLYELSGGVEYNRGRIDENGKLEGLPSQFKSNYTYDGYMDSTGVSRCLLRRPLVRQHQMARKLIYV